MSEEILCHIMTILRNQSVGSSHLDNLKANHFWNIILRATGRVEKLNSNLFVKCVKTSISELAGLLIEKTIDVQFLRQVLEYSNEELFQYFNSAAAKEKPFIIITKDEIAKLRMIYNNYQVQLDILFKFYDEFCSATQVTDVNDYIQDVKQRMKTLDKINVNQVLTSDHWTLHRETLESAKCCYKFNQSQTFRNVFDSYIWEDIAATSVKYIAQILIPAVFEKYNFMYKQLEDWGKLKCSDVYLFWKDVTNTNTELDLMGINRSQELVQTLDHLSNVPLWIERLEQLEQVLGIFKLSHNEVWPSKSICILKDGSMELGQLNKFFDDLYKNLLSNDQDFWNVIKELPVADKVVHLLEKISEHDFNGYDIDSEDDYLDEILVRDMVSSLFQVKRFLFSLMDKESVSDFLNSLLINLKDNHTLSEKIALYNSKNIILQNIYNNISNRREATMEEIKNAVLNGTFTFTRDEKEMNECSVFLKYPSKRDVKYNMDEILDLRRRTLLIAKQKSMVTKSNEDSNKIGTEVSKNAIDEFVSRVDIAQEIVNLTSMLMKIGHLGYRKFEKKLQGTNNMKDFRKLLIKISKNGEY